MSKRRKGSAYLGRVTGLLLTGAAIVGALVRLCVLFFPHVDSPFGWAETILDALSLLLFGLVLLWWAGSGPAGFSWSTPYWDRAYPTCDNWTIGFESVTMIVAVVTAVIAIFTLTHDAFKEEDRKQCSKHVVSEDAKVQSSPSINIVIDSYNSEPCPVRPAAICHRGMHKPAQPCHQGSNASPASQPSSGPIK